MNENLRQWYYRRER